MRRPKFSIRTLMIAVAVVAIALGVGVGAWRVFSVSRSHRQRAAYYAAHKQISTASLSLEQIEHASHRFPTGDEGDGWAGESAARRDYHRALIAYYESLEKKY